MSTVEAPAENFKSGILGVDLSSLGYPTITGKVRDICVIDNLRIMVTTDRTSAYDHLICNIPGKGGVLNLLSDFWFKKTEDIIQNHRLAIPHPNVLIAKQAEETLPVEVILRRYMARSSTSTSIYQSYVNLGRRNIYGLDFPEGLVANQELPMGTIITPTTKAPEGNHDEELTDEQSRDAVDRKLGRGMWEKTKDTASRLFSRAYKYLEDRGLILVDTKYEFGVDGNGDLMLIDEIHTPDSSRFWLLNTYRKRFLAGQNPDTFDKEILRRWLAENGFTGKKGQKIPIIDPSIQESMTKAYEIPYLWITEQKLPANESSPDQILESIQKYLERK